MIKLERYKTFKVSRDYLNWLRDINIIKYTEQKTNKISQKQIKNFLIKILKFKKNDYFFKIIYNRCHVGNLKIGPLDKKNKQAALGYIVGSKKYWNKGIGSEAIHQAVLFAKKNLQLKKLYSRVDIRNLTSIRILKKNGFKFKSKIRFKNRNYINLQKIIL